MIEISEKRKREEIAHYDEKAKNWKKKIGEEKWNTDVHGVRHDLFLSYTWCETWLKNNCKGKTLLDFGCGTGIHSISPAKYGAQVTGIDLSEESLEIAKKRAQQAGLGNKITFQIMDCEKLTFPTQTFDIIFDGGTFSSIDLKKTYPELQRILKPDGYILGIETLAHNPLTNFKRKLNKLKGTRTTWATEHIMTMRDIHDAQQYFGKNETHYFHFFSLFLLPFIRWNWIKPLFKFVDYIDAKLLALPPLKKYGFKVVFIFEKPRKI